MVAAHLMQALCELHVLGGVHELHVSASIGVALCPQHGSDGATLMRRADGALHRAKRDGRSTWRIARAGTHTQSSQQLRLQSGLHRALERNELRLHYQPQFDLASGGSTRAAWCRRLDRVFLRGIQPPPAGDHGRLVAALVAPGGRGDTPLSPAQPAPVPRGRLPTLTTKRLRRAVAPSRG